MPVPRWVIPATLGLAVVGVAVSLYLTITHFGDPDLLVCAEGGSVSCNAVTSSAQSEILGIPVALLGLVWFVGMIVLCVPAAWRARDRRVHQLRTVGVIAGMGFVLWLLYAELIIVGAICLWCTVAHIVAFGMFVVVVMNPVPAHADR
jgi:uncharacterized membrane protein